MKNSTEYEVCINLTPCGVATRNNVNTTPPTDHEPATPITTDASAITIKGVSGLPPGMEDPPAQHPTQSVGGTPQPGGDRPDKCHSVTVAETTLTTARFVSLWSVSLAAAGVIVIITLVLVSVFSLQYTAYARRPPIQEKPCERMYCAFGAQCLVDESNGQAFCRCQENCVDLFAPVCGSDGVTYTSECRLQMASCTLQKRIYIKHQGLCSLKDPCEEKDCRFGAQCKPSLDGRTAECLCPEKCATYGDSRGSRPVCGSDGRDYPSVCELRRTACKEMREIFVKFQGRCDPCEGVECPASQVCQLDDNRNAICRCNAVCSQDFRPVCGSDGKTYTNECTLRVEACKSRRSLRIIYSGECGTGTNPCESLQCGPGQECEIDRYGIATCQCPPPCPPVMRPVCGSDSRTYDSECEMRRQACLQQKTVLLAFKGVCGEEGPCHGFRCHFGALCVAKKGEPSCECPTCSEEFRPVCGSDGISYPNECKLRREACEQKKQVQVAYQGLCNGCENQHCEFYAVCESNGEGEAKCVCPQTCVKVDAPVCGTDALTYQNECELRVAACKKKQYVMVASKGPCDVCLNVHCKYGARCEDGRCVCPTECPETYEPICANDGSTYTNECELRRAACQKSLDLNAIFYGECEESGGSGVEIGSGTKTCDHRTCRLGGICDYDAEGLPHCVCTFHCSPVKDVVCGSDGRLYDNECKMREEACAKQQDIRPVGRERCQELGVVPCDGEPPLLDPVTGREYFCGDGPNSKQCPPSSYCHKSTHFAKCCREVATVRNCAETTFGCCPDGKTPAQGLNNAGCPSVCGCNRLGSYSLTCDPVSKQCPCKPGVGGLRCDRCEPGFWGLHKIAEGNSGCIPCACNEHGSVRDDCEQMTGRCVCKHGIQGMKCDVCPENTILGPDGCTDASIARTMVGSCKDLRCYHGATCREKDGRVQCVCDFRCPPEDGRAPVCGTDGNTYGSECQMRLFSCRYQKRITVRHDGACKRGPGGDVSPTVGPVRRSTIHKTTPEQDDYESKSTRDITHSLPENLYLSTRPTIATPTLPEKPVDVPGFSGRSYLELRRLEAYMSLSVELEFRTFANNGILLYNGQTAVGEGDFVSLSIKDGYVEFRYNLGNGPVVLRSPHRLQPGRMHRLVAKRYLRDGILTLDGQDNVEGRSQGSLQSLDLAENLFLGYVPSESKKVFDNIGVTQGLIGCIRRLRLGRKEMDLYYPGSKDILRGMDIRECSESPCNSLPCQNGASCEATGSESYACSCLPGFTGKQCETVQDPCTGHPCSQGATCIVLPLRGFVCQCPPGRTGEYCEALMREIHEVVVPEMNGQSFMKLPTLQNVGQAFTIEVWFLTKAKNGMIFYNGQKADGRGDFVSLNLVEGFVQFRYDLGSGIANVSSPDPVTLNEWHSVKVTRLRRKGSLQLDDGTIVHGESKAPLSELNLEQPLYVGGFGIYPPSKDSGIRTGLIGAIQRMIVNGEVWENLMSRALDTRSISRWMGPPCGENPCLNGGVCLPQLNEFVCKCPLKFMGRKCEKHMGNEDIDRPILFDGNTFLNFPNKISTRGEGQSLESTETGIEGQRENRFEVIFRTEQPRGLLLWLNKGATIRGDYLALAVVDGYLELSFNLGKQNDLLAIRSRKRVDDGDWHTAFVNRSKRLGVLQIDGGPAQTGTSEDGATELNTDGILWIGGSPGLPTGLPQQYYNGFVGCIDSVKVDDERLHLVMHSTGNIRFCKDS